MMKIIPDREMNPRGFETAALFYLFAAIATILGICSGLLGQAEWVLALLGAAVLAVLGLVFANLPDSKSD